VISRIIKVSVRVISLGLEGELFEAASSPSRETQRDPGNEILTFEPSLPTISGHNLHVMQKKM